MYICKLVMPSEAKLRCCYFPTAAYHIQELLASSWLPWSCSYGIPCLVGCVPHWQSWQKLHMVFECTCLQPLYVRCASLFQNLSQHPGSSSVKLTLGAFLAFVLPCQKLYLMSERLVVALMAQHRCSCLIRLARTCNIFVSLSASTLSGPKYIELLYHAAQE